MWFFWIKLKKKKILGSVELKAKNRIKIKKVTSKTKLRKICLVWYIYVG